MAISVGARLLGQILLEAGQTTLEEIVRVVTADQM